MCFTITAIELVSSFVEINSKLVLSAKVYPEDASVQNLTWKSSNEEIASLHFRGNYYLSPSKKASVMVLIPLKAKNTEVIQSIIPMAKTR